MTASIVICHHKGDLLKDALRTLQHTENVSHETIVMTSIYLDQEPIFQLSQEFKDVHFIYCAGSPSKKRNYALRFAKGDYLVFFDDDVEVKSDTVHFLIEANKHYRTGMVFGKLYNAEYRNRLDEAGGYLTWSGFIWSRAESNAIDVAQFDDRQMIFAGKSAACSIRKDLFKNLAGFDEDFGILGEESDLAWRVWLSGYKVIFEPASISFHKFNTRFKPKDFYTNERVYFNGCRNYITMLLKNLESRNLWILLPHTLVWIASAFCMFLSGKWIAGWNILRGLGYVVRNSGKILHKRKTVQAGRQINDASLFALVLRNPSWQYYLERFKRYIVLGLHG